MVLSKPKIKDLSIQEITGGIVSLFPLIGMGESNMISEEEAYIIFSTLKEMFPNVTLQEVGLALKLAFKGTIKYETDLYNKPFNFAYLGGLINAYYSYRASSEAYKEAIAKIKGHRNPERKLSAEELHNIMNKHCMKSFEECKKGETIDFMLWAQYKHLTDRQRHKLGDYKVKAEIPEGKELVNIHGIDGSVLNKTERINKAILVYNFYTKIINRGLKLKLKSYKSCRHA